MPSQPRQRCRNLSPDGRQCPHAAVPGEDQCYSHDRDRRRRRALRESPKDAPPALEIPLLDNHAAIQVVCTGIARAIVAGTLDQGAARQINATLRIVVQTLSRPAATAAASRKHQQPAPEPIAEIEVTPEGEELAPATPYQVQEAKSERVFSLAELLYRSANPEKSNDPLPEAGYPDPKEPSTLSQLPPTQANAEQNPEPIHQPEPGILPELQAQALTPINPTSLSLRESEIGVPGARSLRTGVVKRTEEPGVARTTDNPAIPSEGRRTCGQNA